MFVNCKGKFGMNITICFKILNFFCIKNEQNGTIYFVSHIHTHTHEKKPSQHCNHREWTKFVNINLVIFTFFV